MSIRITSSIRKGRAITDPLKPWFVSTQAVDYDEPIGSSYVLGAFGFAASHGEAVELAAKQRVELAAKQRVELAAKQRVELDAELLDAVHAERAGRREPAPVPASQHHSLITVGEPS